MSFEEAALCEPLSVALQACQRARIPPIADILIFGAGPIGLLCAAVIKAQREPDMKVTIAGMTPNLRSKLTSDIDASRLQFAQTFCAVQTWRINSPFEDTNFTVKRIAQEHLSDDSDQPILDSGYHLIFECTGAPMCLQMGIHVTHLSSQRSN